MTASPLMLPKLFQYLRSERPDWGAIRAQLRDKPEEASFADESTSQTALQLALLSAQRVPTNDDDETEQSPNSPEQRRGVIKTLLALNPEATMRRCRPRGYTPLALACRTSRLESIDEDAKVVKILIMANRRPINVECDRGLSPLLIHVKSISFLMMGSNSQTKPGTPSCAKESFDLQRRSKPSSLLSLAVPDDRKEPEVASTAILDVLARYYSQAQLEQAIEHLYQCNSLAVMTLLAEENGTARKDKLTFGLKEPRPSTTLAGKWIWEWLLLLLQHISNRLDDRPRTSQRGFYPLHVLSQITGCPPPFVLLCLRAFPHDVRAVLDPVSRNLPLHQIALWSEAEASEHSLRSGTGSGTRCRQSMCLTSLESEHPSGMLATNSHGKTPLELEDESAMSPIE